MTPLKVRFWGTRGSIPAPGKSTLKYGGNTSCVEVNFGDEVFVFDSGTGIRTLGLDLMARAKGSPLRGHIFIGHTHWDHIQGFPFFVPAYIPKNKFIIHSVKSIGDSFETIFRRQMGINYFPVEVGDMASQLKFNHIDTRPFEAEDAKVKTIFTNHPGVNLAYRLDFPGGRSVVYLTDHENHAAFAGDNELARRSDRAIEDFCRGTDLLIVDSQYTDEEYEMKKGWGHSRWKDSLDLGVKAEVKRLALFHHEPVRSDEALDAIAADAKSLAKERGSKLEVFCAEESKEIPI
jgi:phosphoribosyl 1,2-cyclic phosphodiesterase